MRRRALLATLATGLPTLAGCLDDSATPEPNEPTVAEDATAKWSETYLDDGYRVMVTIQLNDNARAEIERLGEGTIRTITRSGTYTVAGPDTDHGVAKASETFTLKTPARSYDGMMSTSTFIVSSQVTPDISVPPMHLLGVSGSTDPDLETADSMIKTYTQESVAGPSSLVLEIPETLHTYYENRRRVPQYGAYVSDSYDDPYLDNLVTEFEDFAAQQGTDTDMAVIEHMISFVQHLEYTTDKVGTGYNEYPKYPIETLVDKDGDCEDTCILLASLLEQFDYGTTLLVFPNHQHMAVGVLGEAGLDGTAYVHDGQHYYYVETTSPGWGLGDAPSDLQNATPEFAPVNSNPVFVFSYAVTISDKRLQVEVKLKNVGDAPGQPTVETLIEDQSEAVVASDRVTASRLAPDAETTTQLHPEPPDDKPLRVKVRIYNDGTPHDMLTSEYQEPIPVDSSS